MFKFFLILLHEREVIPGERIETTQRSSDFPIIKKRFFIRQTEKLCVSFVGDRNVSVNFHGRNANFIGFITIYIYLLSVLKINLNLLPKKKKFIQVKTLKNDKVNALSELF